MNAEQLVPSRETCEALYREGLTVGMGTHFWWHITVVGEGMIARIICKGEAPMVGFCTTDELIPAPTLAEILEMLPYHAHGHFLTLVNQGWGQWEVRYGETRPTHNNPTEAAAQLWLWAEREGYLEVKP